LNVDDDQKGDAMGRKDGEITDDAKTKKSRKRFTSVVTNLKKGRWNK
jgi:hypothetical protein